LGKILDIGFVEIGRRVVEMNGAFEAKLRGPVRETGGRDMIAEGILRPGKLASTAERKLRLCLMRRYESAPDEDRLR
jgi:hypothetical protein